MVPAKCKYTVARVQRTDVGLAEEKEIPDHNIGVPRVRTEWANYRIRRPVTVAANPIFVVHIHTSVLPNTSMQQQ